LFINSSLILVPSDDTQSFSGRKTQSSQGLDLKTGEAAKGGYLTVRNSPL